MMAGQTKWEIRINMPNESFEQLCPHCQTKYQIGPTHYGKRVRCAKCGKGFQADVGPPGVKPESPEFFDELFSQIEMPDDPQRVASDPPAVAPDTKPCPFCAEQIAIDAIKCRFCGTMLVPVYGPSDRNVIRPPESPHNPLLMAFLSGCCIGGLGQIVMGQTIKGIICLLGAMALAPLTGGVSIVITWPALGIDAYMVAKQLKAGHTVGVWEFFPT